MLSLLRKIRKSLVHSGNVRKYLLYAIGEITLVVIGILIALQVNNLNEERKASDAEILSLINLKEEFQKNRTDLLEHIQWKQEVKAEWDGFLTIISNKSLTPEERAIRRPIASFANYIISNSTLNSLLNSGKIDNLNNDTLKYMLTTWQDVVKDYQQFQQIHSDFFVSELKPYERTLFPDQLINHFGFQNPFTSEKNKVRLYLAAYDDMTYQNMLIGNFYWINVQLRRITELKESMDQIIQLLVNEIQLKN